VLEVLGFRFKGERVTKAIATIDDLEDTDKQIKILGQIISLSSSPKKESWDWNRHYMPLNIDSQDNRLMHRQYILELASILAYPLAPTLVTRPLPGSKLEGSDYPTWRIPSEQLELALDALWDSLEPESEKILGNVALLPSITNPAALPYRDIDGNESLLVKNVPGCLLPQQKHSGKDILPCSLCGELTILKDMRNHVGGHILCTFREFDAPDECTIQSVGDNPCGFCGLDGCLTQLLEKKGGGIIITSNCKYHYAQMQYKAAAKLSSTNVPIHCPICPTSVSKAPQTIWKYNALLYLISEHSTGFTPPKIPRQLLSHMHITREEEKALGIKEEVTVAWREEHNIPGTESLLEMVQAEEMQKEGDQTQFPQFFLIVMTRKGLEYMLYQSK
jgi:hypothetical protein